MCAFGKTLTGWIFSLFLKNISRGFESNAGGKKSEAHKKRHVLNTLLTLLFLFHAVSWPVIWIPWAFSNKLLHRRDYGIKRFPASRATSIFRQSSKSTVPSNRTGKYLITKSGIALDSPSFPPMSVDPAGHIHRNNLQPPSAPSYPYFSIYRAYADIVIKGKSIAIVYELSHYDVSQSA